MKEDPLSGPLADDLARMCELYGVNPTLGRLYAVLFTSTEPVALDDLAQRVGAARSTASVAMRRLVDAGVVERLPPRPDRRDWYVPITDPDEVLRRWNARYFAPELAMWRRTLGAAAHVLDGPDVLPPTMDPEVLRRRFSTLAAFVARWDDAVGRVFNTPAPAVRVAGEFES